MYVTLIGWQVAGWAGAFATTLALIIPSTVIHALLRPRSSARNPDAPIGRAMRRGLAPIAIGLTFASAWILVRSINHDWHGYLITALTVAIVLRMQVNPLWLIAAGTHRRRSRAGVDHSETAERREHLDVGDDVDDDRPVGAQRPLERRGEVGRLLDADAERAHVLGDAREVRPG